MDSVERIIRVAAGRDAWHPGRFQAPQAAGGADRSEAVERLLARAKQLQAASTGLVAPGGKRLPAASSALSSAAITLLSGHLRHDPNTPDWPARDRCLFAHAGGEALQRALAQAGLFRTAPPPPRHRQRRINAGAARRVSGMTALEQAVSTAEAGRRVSEELGESARELTGFRTYLFADRVSLTSAGAEAVMARAARLGLSGLVVLLDEGDVSAAGYRGYDATLDRLRAYGWQVGEALDADDVVGLGKAIAVARHQATGPTIIRCRPAGSVSGYSAATGSGAPATCEVADVGRSRVRRWQTRLEALRQLDSRQAEAVMEGLRGADPVARAMPAPLVS